MPYDDPDSTDPMELVGVELPAGRSAMEELAQVFAEEFARMGYDERRLLQLFKSPFYTGAHGAYLALGEKRIREIFRASLEVWGRIRHLDRDADPESGLTLLPAVQEPGGHPGNDSQKSCRKER
jgi:hypothetical protein